MTIIEIRPDGSDSVELEYVLNEDNSPIQFTSIMTAKKYLRENGYDYMNDEEIEDSFRFKDPDEFGVDNTDTTRWAKKRDNTAHLFSNEPGTLCGSVTYCTGNNYATTEMRTCKRCLKIKEKDNGG